MKEHKMQIIAWVIVGILAIIVLSPSPTTFSSSTENAKETTVTTENIAETEEIPEETQQIITPEPISTPEPTPTPELTQTITIDDMVVSIPSTAIVNKIDDNSYNVYPENTGDSFISMYAIVNDGVTNLDIFTTMCVTMIDDYTDNDTTTTVASDTTHVTINGVDFTKTSFRMTLSNYDSCTFETYFGFYGDNIYTINAVTYHDSKDNFDKAVQEILQSITFS